jgi:protein phosphatase
VEKAWLDKEKKDDIDWEAYLQTAIEAANTNILAYAQEHPESAGLGATVVAALVQNQQVTVAWVGDSRIYLWERGRLQQLSRDHSLVARLVEIGQITPAEARTHEHRNVLIRSLGSKEKVTVDTTSCPLRRGGRLVLCSDGLTSHVEDHAIADIVSRHREPDAAALELVVVANADGGSDNISVIVVFHE